MMEVPAESTNLDLPLKAWPELPPDPAAMERVTVLMLSGTRAAQVIETWVPVEGAEVGEPGEPHFRLLAWVWAAAALAGYLSWPFLVDWFIDHPVGTVVMSAIAGLSLIAPLALLPLCRRQCLNHNAPTVRERRTVEC